MVVKVMAVTTSAVAPMDATFSLRPNPASHSATGPLNAASPTMPFSMPIEVMPTCTVERNCVGRSISLSAAPAPASPLSSIAARRALRLDATASSDIANKPLSRVRKTISSRSMQAGRAPGGK